MGKFPARLNDAVNNSIHGNGQINEISNATVLFANMPVACTGDTAKFLDTITGTIQEGNACVLVDNKPVALIGDNTSNDGVVNTGATGIQIDEGNPFVFIGSNVMIGNNVIFTCKPLPAYNQHFQMIDQKTGDPVSNIAYYIKSPSSGIIQGVLNSQGKTNYANADQSEEAKLYAFPQMEIII